MFCLIPLIELAHVENQWSFSFSSSHLLSAIRNCQCFVFTMITYFFHYSLLRSKNPSIWGFSINSSLDLSQAQWNKLCSYSEQVVLICFWKYCLDNIVKQWQYDEKRANERENEGENKTSLNGMTKAFERKSPKSPFCLLVGWLVDTEMEHNFF